MEPPPLLPAKFPVLHDVRKWIGALLFGLLAVLGRAAPCWAQESAGEAASPPSAQRVETIFSLLDNDSYDVRVRAAADFEALMRRPELGPSLAAAVQKALIEPELSFEVRSRLICWAKTLPPAEPPPAEEPAAEAIDRLVDGLDADDYSRRLSAGARLQWYLTNPKVIVPVLERLKMRCADPSLDADVRRRFESIWQSVRGAALAGDPAVATMAPATDSQIERWLIELSAKAVDEKGRAARQTARMELLDHLGCDAESPRVVKAAEAKAAATADPEGKAQLEAILEWAKPAMVAEYWSCREHLSEQHLLVGVSTLSPGAIKPSYFDRIDDQTAHCVSGNSLLPGDYPANVAFLHPLADNAFFRLVNLPTPRRRMAYSYQSKIDARIRLVQISRETLDRFLARKTSLTEEELVLLAQLDTHEVSRFASIWLMQVEDEPLSQVADEPALGSGVRRWLGGRPSRHGLMCLQLALDGTQEAAPGLIEAIRKDRFLPPTSAAPYRLQYLAALSIARRDPWKEADAWLAAQLDSKQSLIESRRADIATVSATAAGVLLKRCDQSPAQFGLQPVLDGALLQLGVEGYRFTTPEGADNVRKFLRAQQEKEARP